MQNSSPESSLIKNDYLSFMLKSALKLLPVCFILLSCQYNQSPETYSSGFSSKQEKIAFLKKHFQLNSNVKDVEFLIVNYGSTDDWFPGPNDSHMQIALKLDQCYFSKWIDTTQGVKEVDPYEEPDWTGILPTTNYWNIQGKKRFFDNGFVWVEENDILLFSHSVN